MKRENKPQHNLRSSIPPRCHVLRQRSSQISSQSIRVESSSQSEVADLELSNEKPIDESAQKDSSSTNETRFGRTSQSALTRTFPGLMSRCRTLAEWMNWREGVAKRVSSKGVEKMGRREDEPSFLEEVGT